MHKNGKESNIDGLEMEWIKKGIKYEGNTEFGKSLDCFETAVEKNKKSKFAWQNLGISYYDNGDSKYSEKAFLAAERIDPKDPSTLRALKVLDNYVIRGYLTLFIFAFAIIFMIFSIINIQELGVLKIFVGFLIIIDFFFFTYTYLDYIICKRFYTLRLLIRKGSGLEYINIKEYRLYHEFKMKIYKYSIVVIIILLFILCGILIIS